MLTECSKINDTNNLPCLYAEYANFKISENTTEEQEKSKFKFGKPR